MALAVPSGLLNDTAARGSGGAEGAEGGVLNAHPRHLRHLLNLLFLLWFTAPAYAQAPPTPIDPAEANVGSDAPPLRIGNVTLAGSLQADATRVNGDPRDEFRDEVKIRRARVGLAGNLTPNIGWNVSAEFTATPVLRNAFIQVRFARFATLRFGQANPPMSIERGTSPTAIEFIDRTRLTSQLTYAQDIGATLYNEKAIAHWLSYAVSVVNGAGFNRSDDNDAKDVVGKLEVAPPWLHHTSFVISAARGEQPRGLRTRETAGFQVDAAHVKVTAEALRENDETIAIRDGFLVTGVYRVRPRHVRPNFRMVELVARYFAFDDPLSAQGLPGSVDDDAAAAGRALDYVPVTTRELQTGGNYYANRNVRVMFNVVVPLDDRTAPGTTLVSRFQVVF